MNGNEWESAVLGQQHICSIKQNSMKTLPYPIELTLLRDYHPQATNGSLFHNTTFICNTIELPWLDNRSKISCIPQGRYRLYERYSPKHKLHLLVDGVCSRKLILIHPANDAVKELAGCIGPVSSLTGIGKGMGSRDAMKKLVQLLTPAFKQQQEAWLTILRSQDMRK